MVAIIHGNAKNMKNALKNTGVIDVLLTCFDISLQLAINGAIDEVPEMKKAVALFKRLAQKLHKSALYEARIKREVKDHNELEDKPGYKTQIVYQKIIQSVATRWNSTCMLIELGMSISGFCVCGKWLQWNTNT